MSTAASRSPLDSFDKAPRPLKAFEQYMWEDERPGWPMTIWWRLVMSEPLDQERLQTAMRVVQQRHPQLAWRLTRNARGKLNWVPGPEQEVDCSTLPAGELQANHSPLDQHISLFDEPGWRTVLRPHAAGCELWCGTHHSLCDGLGSMQIISELLQAYSNPSSLPLHIASPFEENLPAGVPGGMEAFRDKCRQWFWMLERAGTYFFTNPRSLQHPKCEAVPSQVQFLSAEVGSIADFRKAADQQDCTINDLLLRDLFVALAQQAESCPRRRNRLRIFIPMNLRTEGVQSIRNVVGMVHMDCVMNRNTDREVVLERVTRMMHRNRRLRLGRVLPMILDSVLRVLGTARPLLHLPRCAATTVFSNLGQAFAGIVPEDCGQRMRAGTAEVLSIEPTPPIRPLTPLTFAVLSYCGQLRLAMRYQPSHFSCESAAAIFQGVQEQFQLSLADVHDSPAK